VFRFWKRLREEVGELLFGGDVRDLERTALKMISNEVVPDVDVLGSPVIALSVGQGDGGLVIGVQDSWLDRRDAQFGDVVHAGQELANGFRESHVFGVHCGQRNVWLFPGTP